MYKKNPLISIVFFLLLLKCRVLGWSITRVPDEQVAEAGFSCHSVSISAWMVNNKSSNLMNKLPKLASLVIVLAYQTIHHSCAHVRVSFIYSVGEWEREREMRWRARSTK